MSFFEKLKAAALFIAGFFLKDYLDLRKQNRERARENEELSRFQTEEAERERAHEKRLSKIRNDLDRDAIGGMFSSYPAKDPETPPPGT